MPANIRLLAIAAGVAVVLSGTFALAEGDPDSAIKYRKAVMGTIGGNMTGTALIVQGKVDFKDNLVAHTHALAEAAKLAPAAFKQNTDGQGGEKTTATGKIWSDMGDFEKRLTALQEETAKLASVAESGDMGMVGEQLGAVGKVCKGCHDNFREK